MCRTLNSDIVTQSNALSNQLSNHDTDIKSLLNNKGCVKSVQRGYVKEIHMKKNEKSTFEIPISDINPDKSIILINYHDDYHIDVILSPSLTKNKLLIPYDNPSTVDEKTGKFDYQIIEFY